MTVVKTQIFLKSKTAAAIFNYKDSLQRTLDFLLSNLDRRNCGVLNIETGPWGRISKVETGVICAFC
jgi:hypothetical protein